MVNCRVRKPLGAVILWWAAAEAPKGLDAWLGEDPHTRAERLKRVVPPARFCLLKTQPDVAQLRARRSGRAAGRSG